MALLLPNSDTRLEELADEVSGLLDAIAAGAVNAGADLQRLLVDVLEQIEAEIADKAAADSPLRRDPRSRTGRVRLRT